MIVRTMNELTGSERDVGAETWRSVRFVLAAEGVGFSLHDTVLHAGTSTDMWYRDHIEAVYCVGGEGVLEDFDNGKTYQLGPGTMYLLDGHEHHRVTATTDLHTVCVFNPPCTGREVHDEDGAYPLLVEPTGSTQ